MDQFKTIINNKVLRIIIFDKVKFINRKYNVFPKTYTYQEYLDNKDNILIINNKLDLYKEFIAKVNKDGFNFPRGSCVIVAIKYGRIKFLQYFIKRLKIKVVKGDLASILYYGAYSSNFKMVKYLHHPKHSVTYRPDHYGPSLVCSANSDNLEMIQYLSEKYGHLNPTVIGPSPLERVASMGHLEIFKWLFENRPNDQRKGVLMSALSKRKIEIADWFVQSTKDNKNLSEWCINFDNLALSENGDCLESMKWAMQKQQQQEFSGISIRCTTEAMNRAAQHSLEMVKWLQDNRTEGCTEIALLNAAKNTDMDIAKFLFDNRPNECCTSRMYYNLATKGYLKTFKLLEQYEKKHNLVLPGHTITDACRLRNNLPMVKYLHFNRSDGGWTFLAMDGAAKYGDLEILKFLHKNRTEGCSERAVIDAVVYGHADVAIYLLENQLAQPTEDLINRASKLADQSILDFIIKILDEKNI